ncbi:MAG: DUF4342 domain-containing protein [Peptococcia bacterium]
MDELAKIDLLRERLAVSYRQAKEALDQAGGDVVQALVYLEGQETKWDKNMEDKARQLGDYIKELIRKGNITKIRLKKQDKIVLEIPATLGAIGVGGALLSPFLAVIAVVGTVAAFVKNYRLEVVRPDGKVEEHDLGFLEDEE